MSPETRKYGLLLTRRNVLLGATFTGTSVLAQTLVPQRHVNLLGHTKLDALIPREIGSWSFESVSGLVVPPQDDLKDQLYSDVLTRVYTARDMPTIMLLIAQSPVQNGILQLHRPEVCYPFSGYKLSPIAGHDIGIDANTNVQARFLTATASDRVEQILYWTRIGHSNPGSWMDERMAVAKANLRGVIPDGILVRISSISPDRTIVRELDLFAQAMFKSLSAADRRTLFWY
jgi:EpsI family protein